jgi:hypothetical protein
MQVTMIGMGFISIAQGVINLVRALLVYTTCESADPPDQVGLEPDPGQSAHALGLQTPLQLRAREEEGEYKEDNPRLRFRYRCYTDVANLSFISSIVPGVIGNTHHVGVDLRVRK